MLSFATPGYLLLLLPAAGISYFRSRGKMRPKLRIPLTSAGRVFPAARFGGNAAAHILPWLKIAALLLMIVALAGPRWGVGETTVYSEGINIVLAVDVSNSMEALDFTRNGKRVNRLEAVKGVVRDFIDQRHGDRIGLTAFGTHAYTQIPLTIDYQSLIEGLEALEIGSAGKSTAVGDALGISLKRLQDVESKSNVVILLTDGQSNAGELTPETAARIAAEKGVKVYTIGVGSRGKVPFVHNDPLFGRRVVYRQVNIDEETLRTIADITGGMYFKAEDTEGLQEIYDTVDEMETTEREEKTYIQYTPLYEWFLLPALGLLLLWIVLTRTRYLRVP